MAFLLKAKNRTKKICSWMPLPTIWHLQRYLESHYECVIWLSWKQHSSKKLLSIPAFPVFTIPSLWRQVNQSIVMSPFYLAAPWRPHLTALWQQKWMEGPSPTWQADPLPWRGGWARHVLDSRLEMLPPWVPATLAAVPVGSSTQTPPGSCIQRLSVELLSLGWETCHK